MVKGLPEAFNVHGLSDAFLAEKPLFAEIAEEFATFLGDSPLVIHNASFDLGFINAEFGRLGYPQVTTDRAIDTVHLARKKFPGSPANLDALCRRFQVDISDDPNFEVQAHSMTHPYRRSSNLVTWVRGDTPGKNGKDAIYELVESKAMLERNLGVPIDYFAWPGGWYNSDLIDMAKRVGYRALFTAEGAGNRPGRDVYRMHRFVVDGACPLRVFKLIVLKHQHVPCPPISPPRPSEAVQTAQREEVLPE